MAEIGTVVRVCLNGLSEPRATHYTLATHSLHTLWIPALVRLARPLSPALHRGVAHAVAHTERLMSGF